MTKKSVFFVSIFVCTLMLGCTSDKGKKVVVDFSSPAPDSSVVSFHQDEAIHVAIAAMTSPRESFMYYNELLQYISSIIDMPVHYIQKESYEEVNSLLEQNAVDFAFICSGAYIEAKKAGTVRLLVGPVINNKKSYSAYIIANKNSKATELGELRGQSFAFTDPLSHTGYNYPIKKLKDLGVELDEYFSKTVFTYGHDLSIEMVNRGIIDAASVHGLIYEYLLKFNPDKIVNTKIIEHSEDFGIPPVVTPINIDNRRYKLYKDIFMNLHKDPRGKQILNNINIEYYSELSDEMYDGVRRIKELSND